MQAVPTTVTISEFKTRPNAVLDNVRVSPVVLIQHGAPTAVLVDPAEWNRIAKRLAYQEAHAEALATLLRIDQSKEKTYTHGEVEERIAQLQKGLAGHVAA